MKLLSIAVPSYNSQDYLRHCVDSLLVGGDEVEILIVNDGSTDATKEIADELEAAHPGIVRAIHKQNGGHGSAVNAGIEHATGKYFKVVDSDDWVDAEAYRRVLDTLRSFAGGDTLDMLLANYVYEKEGKKHKAVMRYTSAIAPDKMHTWHNIRPLPKGRYFLMHSIIYRTQLLRDCGLKLPEHTFYVDNLYAFIPLQHVKNFYYINVDFYRYYIGREGQSVQEETMIKRIDQQIRVNKLMIDSLGAKKQYARNQWHYLLNYLEIVTSVTSVLAIRSGTEENLEKRKDVWQYIRTQKPEAYFQLRHGVLGTVMNWKSVPGRALAVSAYRVSQWIVGFN